jgi:hypothetical protein
MKESKQTGRIDLVRRSSTPRDTHREQVVLVDREPGLLGALGSVLPIGGVKYVVPSGRLEQPIDYDGGVLEVTIETTRDRLLVYPCVRVMGLAGRGSREENGRVLAAVLRDSLDARSLVCER